MPMNAALDQGEYRYADGCGPWIKGSTDMPMDAALAQEEYRYANSRGIGPSGVLICR